MKTTIDIREPLLVQTRKAAAEEGRTVRSFVEEALQKLLDERASRAPKVLRDVSFTGNGLTAEYQEKGLMQAIYDSYPSMEQMGIRP